MKVVGLTGGIATGKSTVARMFREAGVPVVDADHAARAVVEPGSPALAAIAAHFGPEVLDEHGRLQRAWLRARIIHSAADRKVLEGITHPAIAQHIGQALRELEGSGAPLAAVEAALMVETGSYRMYAALVVVTCEPALQLQRVMARDAQSEAEARAFIATQLPLSKKEAVATHLLHNNSDLQALQTQVDQVLADLGSTAQ